MRHQLRLRIAPQRWTRVLRMSTSTAALITGLAAAGASFAAEEATIEASPASTGVALDELVVTARRRGENLQEVPVAATVISGEQLRAQGAVNTRDVLLSVPNLTVSTGSRGSRDAVINVRGLATADTSPVFDPSVGIYVNDIYQGRSAGSLTDTIDLESVQVLRGPQGTLFGRNSVGGAVLVATKRPEPVFGGELQAKIGNYDGVGGHAILNVPLGSEWAVRGVVRQYKRKGYGKNLLTGFDNLNNEDNTEWRVSLQGEVSSRITLFASYDGVDEASNGRAATPIGTVPAINFTTAVATQLGLISPSTQLPAPGSLGEHETTGLIANGRDATRIDRVSGAVTWRLADHVTFNLLAGYQKLRNKSTTDQDGTPALIANASMPNHQQQRYYEGRFSGELLGSRVEWILGGNFFNEQAAIEVLTNPERATTRSDSLSFVQNQSYAGFAHLSFDVTEQFSIAGGVRQTYDRRNIQTAVYRGATNSIATCGVNVALRAPGGCEARARAKFDYVSWEGTANYRFTDNVMAYARAAKGQKSGGFNASVQTGFLNPFNPETLLQYELGLKSELFDRRVRFDVAAYSGDYKQIQRQVIRIIRGAPSVFVSNAAAATVKGAEAELTVAPAEGLQLRAGIGYTDAEYDAWNFVDPVTGAREDLSKNRFAIVPKYTYRLSAQYRRDLGPAIVSASASWNATSKYFLSPENRNDFIQDGYGLLSARLAVLMRDEDVEVALFGNNLTDKYYNTFGSVYGLPAGALLVPVSGQPRMVGASLTYRFR